MSALADFFLRNIIAVYFFYGLSFFSMGLAIFLEVGHTSELDFSKALWSLAAFGLIHGSHEWFEMFLLIHPDAYQGAAGLWITMARVLLLAISFTMLVTFGARLIAGPSRPRFQWLIMGSVGTVWLVGLIWVIYTQPDYNSRGLAADVYTRYALAIPGAVLTAWGLILQRRQFIQAGMSGFGQDVTFAALAFILYGCVGQLFASPSVIFPSAYLNADIFVRWFGIPIQVFRALMACMAAIFIVRSLRAFEEENQRHINTLQEAQLAERRRLEATRSELLHRTVKAQEMERQRIARELHDETGQTLTALGLGLRGLSETINTNPNRAIQQAQQLQTVAVDGLEELQRQVSGLRPPQLDDLGLLAALRWYANEITKHYSLPINLTSHGSSDKLDIEMRIVLFRIVQEAITNVMRHAQANQVSITLENTEHSINLKVEDDGVGFDAEKVLKSKEMERSHWGLLGMMERAALVGGDCQILSQPGKGTRIIVKIKKEDKHV